MSIPRSCSGVRVDNNAYALDRNGREYATGEYDSPFTVPAYGETIVSVLATGWVTGAVPQNCDTPTRASVSGATSALSRSYIRGKLNSGFSGAAFDTPSELAVLAPAGPAG